MNPAQRRVLVRGLLLAGCLFGAIGVDWLTDGDTDNDARGLFLLILAVAAIITGLFVRAGTPETPPRVAAPRQPDERPPSVLVQRGIKAAIADWKKKRETAKRP